MPGKFEQAALSSQPLPEVSIIVPVYNEGPRLCQTLEAIRDTAGVRHEIIVVNDASTDSGCDVLRADPPPFENLMLVDLPQRQGVAHARNLGAGHATAPILIAMDAHCVPGPGWLEKLLEELHKPGVGIVAPQISSLECPAATTFGLTIRDRELGVDWLHQQNESALPGSAGGLRVHGHDPGVLRSDWPFRRHAQLWNGRRGVVYPRLAVSGIL